MSTSVRRLMSVTPSLLDASPRLPSDSAIHLAHPVSPAPLNDMRPSMQPRIR